MYCHAENANEPRILKDIHPVCRTIIPKILLFYIKLFFVNR